MFDAEDEVVFFVSQVCKHLTKLFDCLAQLEFETDENGEVKSKNAFNMFSKDGEKVSLAYTCDCDGQVEAWLNRVLEVMMESVRKEFTEAVVAYEEKPRDQWLFDFPAQVKNSSYLKVQ